MSPEHEQWHLRTRAALDECFDQIRFARATELARSGRYLEAEALLSPNGQPSTTPRDLDLLARIAVLQGRTSDARRLWEAAVQRAPENPTYPECLHRLGDLPRFRITFDAILACLVWITIVLGMATLIYVFLLRK
jgi:hypothetical protein